MVACRTPTEVTVQVRTNLPCTEGASWHGISVYTGAPGLDVETRAPVLTSTTCDADGNVGSLVVVPSASKETTIAIRVVAGITREPRDCAANGYQGCIVERRTVSFLPHDSLEVDIALTGECVGQACDALTTCVAGTCADARLNVPPAGDIEDAGPHDSAMSADAVRWGTTERAAGSPRTTPAA